MVAARSKTNARMESAARKSQHRTPKRPSIKPNRPPTEFESSVYDVCSRIPAGKVSTYGNLARVLGSSSRAVGQALKRNPFAPRVPCHRVVATSLQLGGFHGSSGDDDPNVQRKRKMLLQEGVPFEKGRLVGQAAVMTALELADTAEEDEAGNADTRSSRA